MPRLEIRLLGPFEALRNGAPVTSFETESARALLAYLASEPGRARSRPAVAEMFWPERPEGAALSNLRHVLSVLRRALGDPEAQRPVLLADRSTVTIDPGADVWVDLVEFERLAATPPTADDAVPHWTRAAELWRGPLLEGLNVRAGAEWEEWLIVTAERARRELALTLGRLADHHERSGAWDLAVPITDRLVEVDPWDERAHRRLMRLLSRSAGSAPALAHFHKLEALLHDELGTRPEAETLALADTIRAGDLARLSEDTDIAYPAFLTGEPATSPVVFVGRTGELADLHRHLEAALAGRGKVILVAGEAGSGKTMLARELMRQSTSAPDLLTAMGNCNAFAGIGDPYLPFREMLGQLCGNVESGFAAGALDKEQATRLWEAIPHSARLISDIAPSLVGVMVNGGLLVDRAEQATPGADWLGDFRTRIETAQRRPPAPERFQPALFDDYTSVLERLSITRPLLLILDDLQWADRGSVALLWHLSRRIERMRALLVCMYRPEEVGPDSVGGPSLLDVVRDLQTRSPDCMNELRSDREFVDAFLDAEPNALDRSFRDRLAAYTDGHPLFTVEMVRGMQERAELRRDRAGMWQVGGSLDWDQMPSRVEAVIAQRIERLPEDLRRDLSVASVQGQEFLVPVVGVIRADPEASARMSREGTTPHRLIDPSGVERVGDELVARHRFRHVLFQRYLYDCLGPEERVRLHEASGRAIERIYDGHPDVPVVDLARHFDEAGLTEPTIHYLHEAGQRAVRMSAYEEAIAHMERALELLASLPESSERDRLELDLLAALAAPVMAVRGYAAPEAERIGNRVLGLRNRVGPSATMVLALTGLATVLGIRARYPEAVGVSEEALALGETVDHPPGLTIRPLQLLGYNLTWMGELQKGHDALERAHQDFDPIDHAWLTFATGGSPGPDAMVWDAINTLHRGLPDRAIALADRGVAAARDLGHAFTLCHALAVGGSVLRAMTGDYGGARPFIEEFEAIANAEHFPFYQVAAVVHRGQLAGYEGDPEAGIASITEGLEAWRSNGIEAFRGPFLGDVGVFHHRMGATDEGLAVIGRALDEAASQRERLSRVILLIQQGELRAALGDDTRARASFESALAAARASGMLVSELRAATELAKLLRVRDAHAAADVLAPVYTRLDEGQHSPYVVAARDVLEAL